MYDNKLPNYLDNLEIILCQPRHPGNIGSVARAMKNMGFSKLTLVSPCLIKTPMTHNPPIFNDKNLFKIPEESYILASGAKELIDNINFSNTLENALKNTNASFALSSRKREISTNPLTPKKAVNEIINLISNNNKVSLVFGNETSGLSINELQLCSKLITIPGNPNYCSINLAQAVQIIVYEIYSTINNNNINYLNSIKNLATQEQVFKLIEHFEKNMQEINFFEKKNKQRLMRRITKMFLKTQLEKEEIDILRGFLSTSSKCIFEKK